MIPDRSPLLTKTQWEVLLDQAEDMPDADKRAHKSRARNRIRDCLCDFAYVFSVLSKYDREQVFEDIAEYRAYRSYESGVAAESLNTSREDSIDDPRVETGIEIGRMRAVDPPSNAAEDGKELYNGLVALLAFLYAGIDDREEFAVMLEDAIRAEREADDLLPLSVEVSITVEREHERREILKRLEDGDITPDELIEALNADPTLIFDSLDTGDEDTDEE